MSDPILSTTPAPEYIQAAAEALRRDYGEPPERGMMSVEQWERWRDRMVEAEMKLLAPFFAAAWKAGYESAVLTPEQITAAEGSTE